MPELEPAVRWEEMLEQLHYLRLHGYSGFFVFRMRHGQATRSTLERLQGLARRYRLDPTPEVLTDA